MSENDHNVRVAVVQAAPIIMDKKATVKNLVSLTVQAAQKGAKILLFPEAFIPAYPRGLTFGTSVGSRSEEGKKDFFRYPLPYYSLLWTRW